MTNYTPQRFAASLLRTLGIHQTPGAVQALVGWENAEGGHWHNDAKHNPLNTTLNMPGSGDTGTQGNISVYRSWDQGLEATAKTLANYPGIRKALASGNPNAVAAAIGSSSWGTSGSLVARAIAGTPRVAGVHAGVAPSGSSGGSVTSPDATMTRTVPGEVTAGGLGVADLLKAIQPQHAAVMASAPQAPQFSAASRYLKMGTVPMSVGAMGGGSKPSVADLLAAVQTSPLPQDKKVTTKIPGVTTQVSSAAAPSGKGGVANFEGKQVAAWIAPVLAYARKQGWKGTVNSGYRSLAEQTRIYNSGVRPAAKPGTSNHEGTQFPRGAVDVTDAAQLSAIIAKSKYAHLLQWAGAKDPVHFSHPHNGSY